MERAGHSGDKSRHGKARKHKRGEDEYTNIKKQKKSRPVSKGDVKEKHEDQTTFIVFDLETTGLNKPRHITQIAALALSSDEPPFDRFVMPKKTMEQGAIDLTGIRVTRSMVMEYRGNAVESISITEAITRFLDWLNRFPKVILIAHYGREFDFGVLLAAARNTGLEARLDECVHGYVDSWEVFHSLYPGRRSYKQVDLVDEFIGESYTGHEAVQDATMLKKLIIKTISIRELFRFKLLKCDIEI